MQTLFSAEELSTAICIVPVAPMRAMASHRAEMVSQLLFGERCRILENEPGGWVKVQARFDGYEGWCQQGQLHAIAAELFDQEVEAFAGDWVNDVMVNGEPVRIPLGASLPGFHPEGFSWGKLQLLYKGILWRRSETLREDVILKGLAFQFLHTGYLWGGKSVFGVDCSGFVQQVFKLMGVPLLRDASMQAGQGKEIGFLEETRCGDLAFFDNEEGKITHVGLLLGDGQIIHASGEVRVDTIHHEGIISSATGERTHKLRLLRRVLPEYVFE